MVILPLLELWVWGTVSNVRWHFKFGNRFERGLQITTNTSDPFLHYLPYHESKHVDIVHSMREDSLIKKKSRKCSSTWWKHQFSLFATLYGHLCSEPCATWAPGPMGKVARHCPSIMESCLGVPDVVSSHQGHLSHVPVVSHWPVDDCRSQSECGSLQAVILMYG
jgi:hypothetical protein